MLPRLLAAITVLAAAAVVLVASWPQLLGLHRELYVAQVVSLRGAVVVAAGVLLVLCLLLATARRARRFAASLAVLALVGGLLNLAVLAGRGAASAEFEAAGPDSVTVLAWNTLGEAPGAEVLADLVAESGADVVALPETTLGYAEEVAALLTERGVAMRALGASFDQVAKANSTSLLIAERLGDYRVDETLGSTSVLPSVVAVPVDGEGPAIGAVHPVAPVPAYMQHWRDDLAWVAGACTADDTILAGDFNSTLDHWAGLGVDGGDLGVCSDAAVAAGSGAVGTWPTDAPPLLGSAIDHVVAGPAWRVTGARVVEGYDDAGSDHRPVVAQLTPAR